MYYFLVVLYYYISGIDDVLHLTVYSPWRNNIYMKKIITHGFNMYHV